MLDLWKAEFIYQRAATNQHEVDREGLSMTIVWGRWEAYPWKNELAVQSERVTIHFNEILSDSFEGQHNPFDMLDRAIVLSGFAVRRMIEKRLVTDRLAKAKIPVRTFTRSGGSAGQRHFPNSANSV